MIVSHNWLSQYIDLSSYTPADLAAKLTMAGIEVEAMETSHKVPEGVIVAKILERKPHTDSDHLSICKVFDGKEEIQIVCGAPNCDAGNIVPLATIGTVLIDRDSGSEFKIKKSKVRGVESLGMMCSGRELGLDNDHNGLMILSADLKPGTPLRDLYPGDTVYELETTPNRPDWLSHWGIARDLASLLRKEAHLPEFKRPAVTKNESPANLVTVDAPDLCPRYTARIIRGVTIKESPDWLKERLTAIGLRPINNVVDITNFVLMELGHPLHVFDLADLEGGRIVVRRAGNGEIITTLDNKQLKLKDSHLVICDAVKPVALAGIMGGLHSGVTEKATDVLLESALFNPTNIRTSSRELGISSDSSYRYERGADWDMVETASDRAASLILELAGGELVTERIDVSVARPQPQPVICRFQRIRDLIGAPISDDEIIEILSRLDLKMSNRTATECYFTAPLFRYDIKREADLAEEVARIYGLDNIPVVPVNAVAPAPFGDDTMAPFEELRHQLIGLGLYECMNYTMISNQSALLDPEFAESDLIRIGNPLNVDMTFLRPSLFGEMMATVERNLFRRNQNLRLFEVGRCFCANKEKYPEERQEICIVLSGQRHPERFSGERTELFDFYDLKGMVESFLELRRIGNVKFNPVKDGKFDYAAEIVCNERVIGRIGQVARKFASAMKARNPILMAMIQVNDLFRVKVPAITYAALSQFPGTSRDIAFVAPEALTHQEVVDFITKAKLKSLEKVELFDIFRDEKSVGAGKKSLAYSLTFRHPERTLTDDEVNNSMEKLRERLAKELQVELR